VLNASAAAKHSHSHSQSQSQLFLANCQGGFPQVGSQLLPGQQFVAYAYLSSAVLLSSVVHL